MKLYKLLPALTLILVMGLLCSCSEDRESYDVSNNKEKLVSFSVRVPGSGAPKTYALTENDENEVKNIVILLFDADGKYTYQPVYNNKITTDQSDSRLKTFTAKIPDGTYKHMVILANANTIVGDVLSGISVGESKADVLNKLLLSNSGRWNSKPGSNGYISIPMWGEISNITVNSSLSGDNSVSLVRMIAKIDVSLGTAGQSKFKLKSVRLYNFNNKGQVAPNDADWDLGQGVAITPSVPSTANKPSNPAQNPLVYDGDYITTPDISCTGEIFTFEAAAGSASTLQNNTCLVIGGFYGNETQETFYRIDFAKTESNTTTYLALLRNHHYRVNILDVSAPGLGNPEDAFNSTPANIRASIVEWSDGRFTDFVVNDQYLIGVSQGEFTFSREERTASSLDNILSIITDYSGGWKIEKIVDVLGTPVTWLKTNKVNGNNTSGDDIRLLLDENNGTENRTAFIHIVADRLTYIVKVNQNTTKDIGIRITDINNLEINVLEFGASKDVQPDAQQFTVSWTPKDNDLYFNIGALKNAFTFASGSDVITSGSLNELAGTKTYTIQPPVITSVDLASNPFQERTSVVLYSVSEGSTTVNKTLTLRQLVYNLVAETKSFYHTNDKTYSFFVKSNTQWRIKSVNETIREGNETTLLALKSTDNLLVGTVGEANTTTGVEIKFSTPYITTSVSSDIKVVFESTASPAKFSDVTIELKLGDGFRPPHHSGWAGSNIYWDGTKLTFDGVGVTTHEQYQGLYFNWGSLYGISPLDSWSGNTILYAPSGVAGTASSMGRNNYLLSIPKPDGGNIIKNLDRAYLYEILDSDQGIGDICKYMTDKGWAPSGKWRMPTANEFKAQTDYQGRIAGTGVVNNTGTGTFTAGFKRIDVTPNVFFPCSGARRLGNGEPGNTTIIGHYWSSSAIGEDIGYALLLRENGMVNPISTSYDPSFGFPVRCVRE